MRRIKAERMVRVDENLIFYTCLTLVLAIAAFGLAMEMLAK